MNVFGVTAETAVNTLSAAADSSSTSIAQMVESFSAVASAAAPTGQTIFGVSQALAVLAGQGMKGAEAGTGLKTVLMKLLAPTKEAKEALAVLGLQQEQFVDGAGKMLPIAQVAEIIADAMGDMSDEGREAMMANEALIKVFDTFGIRAIFAFASAGKKGFAEVAEAMEESRTVSQKFEIAMSGLTGVGNALFAVVERLAIAFSDRYFTAAVRVAAQAVIPIIDAMSWLLTSVPVLSPILASVSGAMVTIGVAALGAGAMLQFVNFGLRGYIGFAATATLMTRAFSVAVGGLTAALVGLRAVMQAIPGWGWALAAITALGGLAYWMSTASTQADAASKSGIMRDANRPPMAGPGAAGMAGAQPGLGTGDSASTFSGQIASRLVFGPSLTAAQETADNTGRMADGIDELVQATMRGEAVGEDSLQAFAAAGAAALEAQVSTIPQVSAIRGGIKALTPVMAGGVALNSVANGRVMRETPFENVFIQPAAGDSVHDYHGRQHCRYPADASVS
jgi:TP901 family phage tail tape measure protein